MMGPQARIFKKVVEFLGCVACLLGKFFTDIEARRVFLTRQKWSREWSLLHNIFWNTKGDAYAWITYGGFSIITLLFGISIILVTNYMSKLFVGSMLTIINNTELNDLCIDSKSRPTYAEKIFLFIGSLMFFTVGGLVLASIDQVPDELIDNAIVLGILSFFVAFVFLIDMSEKMGKRRSDATQTDTSSIDRHYTKSLSSTTISSQANLVESEETNRNNRDSIRSHKTQTNINSQDGIQMQSSLNPFVTNQKPNEQLYPHQHDQGFSSQPQSINSAQHKSFPVYSEDIVETQTLPSAQQPVFSKVKQSSSAISHLETEPYKKILSRTNQSMANTRYHDQAKLNNDPTFYDDFNNYQKQSYYQGPKVDQGKLMVIRDYSQQPSPQHGNHHTCNCQNQHYEDNDDQERDNIVKKSGYVNQVAKLWDSRLKSNEGSVRSNQKNIIGLNTVV